MPCVRRTKRMPRTDAPASTAVRPTRNSMDLPAYPTRNANRCCSRRSSGTPPPALQDGKIPCTVPHGGASVNDSKNNIISSGWQLFPHRALLGFPLRLPVPLHHGVHDLAAVDAAPGVKQVQHVLEPLEHHGTGAPGAPHSFDVFHAPL